MKSTSPLVIYFPTTSIVFFLIMAMLADTAWAYRRAVAKVYERVDLSRDAKRSLEKLACLPFKVAMQESTAIGFDDKDNKKIEAAARCAPHAMLYKQPIVFERICNLDGTWRCEAASEILLAKFSDRRVYITAEGLSLTEAYWILSYFISNNLIKSTDAYDYFKDYKQSLDKCRVKKTGENRFYLTCNYHNHSVERIYSNGLYSYHEIP